MDPAVKLHTNGRHKCGRNAEVDGDLFKYKGGKGGSVGVVKILEPISPMLNYFEYLIVDKGRKTALGIGVGAQSYSSSSMPGWDNNAIGYHADDGRLFHQDGYGREFGPLCTTGDRMGCGVEFSSDATRYVNVFFTKNGQLVGEPVRMERPAFGLYPLIGLHSEGEKVRYLGHWRRVSAIGDVAEPMETRQEPSNYWLRSNGVAFLDNPMMLEYAGDGLNRQDVGIAQALHRITPTNHYFELTILDAGKEGWIAIGLAKKTYILTKHPGWCNGSVGYHADNGHLYKERGMGDPFGPTCTTGDTMGCGIRFPLHNKAEKEKEEEEEEEDEDSDSSVVDQLFEHNLLFGMEDDYDDLLFDGEDLGFGIRRPVFGRGLFAGGRRRRLMEHVRQKENRESDTKTRKKCTVYFTKNGAVVGETECTLPKSGFYPVVAMLSDGEKIRVDLRPLSG